MIIVLLITLFLILLYLVYPLWLTIFWSNQRKRGKRTVKADSVTVILLTYNGGQFLENKIRFLLNELSVFKNRELIIIDDHSSDDTVEIANKFNNNEKDIRVISKKSRKGIPDSMNLGIKIAKYETVVFCDQRQSLSGGSLKLLVKPLEYENVGAVSGCISPKDGKGLVSFIRKYENYLKTLESKSGNLIGVYGPLYAIKKSCYHIIPENVILDDLYLSLRMLPGYRIEMQNESLIFESDQSKLYNYKRIKRYLAGFWQIITDKELMKNLPAKQKVILLWHKYLRLLIPVFLLLTYVAIGIKVFSEGEYIALFIALTIAGLLSFFPVTAKINFNRNNILRISILYFIALFDILKSNLLVKNEQSR